MKNWWSNLDLHISGRWFLLSAMVGIMCGLAAILFHVLCQVVAHLLMVQVAGYSPGDAIGEHQFLPHLEVEFHPLWLLAIITIGGMISGLLVSLFAPEAAGHGTDAAIHAFHHRHGKIKFRVPIVKAIASAITLGTGGSGGREGPIAQIGAGVGSTIAQYIGLPARERRILLAAGLGAGVGAIFRAPLAGALFAAEILYREEEFESDVIVPAAIASIISYAVYSFCLPPEIRFTPLFGKEIRFEVASMLELIPYTVLAVVLVIMGMIYIETLSRFHKWFTLINLPRWAKPALGAFLAGLVGLGMYFAFSQQQESLAVLSTGYGTLQHILLPNIQLPILLLLSIALVKILTTALTLGSGGSGGVFGPSMVIGGTTGAAIGQWLNLISPAWLAIQPQAFAIVGMAGFFSGCAHAPISTIIMVSELTGEYNLLLPAMWVSTICFLLMRRQTLYSEQMQTRLESPVHKGDFIIDVLEGITVEEVYQKDRQLVCIDEGMSLEDIVHKIADTHQHYFPVMNAERQMVGIFSADDVRSYLYNETIWKLANARDIMVSNIVSVTPNTDLNLALRKFTARNLDELPVLDPNEPGKLLGMLRRKETIAAYNRRLFELKHKYAEAEA